MYLSHRIFLMGADLFVFQSVTQLHKPTLKPSTSSASASLLLIPTTLSPKHQDLMLRSSRVKIGRPLEVDHPYTRIISEDPKRTPIRARNNALFFFFKWNNGQSATRQHMLEQLTPIDGIHRSSHSTSLAQQCRHCRKIASRKKAQFEGPIRAQSEF